MRILGFSKRWAKLDHIYFTTFRYPRKDRDWYVGEVVQVVYHPRHKDRYKYCNAQIVSIERRCVSARSQFPPTPVISETEAFDDGFISYAAMYSWLCKTYGDSPIPVIDKITLIRGIGLWERD